MGREGGRELPHVNAVEWVTGVHSTVRSLSPVAVGQVNERHIHRLYLFLPVAATRIAWIDRLGGVKLSLLVGSYY